MGYSMGYTFDDREETTMHVVEFVGAKGGQGTSTLAVLYGLRCVQRGLRVHLLALDETELELAVIAGASAYDTAKGWSSLTNLMTWGTDVPPGTEVVVADGTISETVQMYKHLPPPVRVLVVRNCFLALRAVFGPDRRFDHKIAVIEPGRALTIGDMRSAIGDIDIELQWDPAIARAVDAGLLHIRAPRSISGLDTLVPDTERLCSVCESNPAEPKVGTCDNDRCKSAAQAEETTR